MSRRGSPGRLAARAPRVASARGRRRAPVPRSRVRAGLATIGHAAGLELASWRSQVREQPGLVAAARGGIAGEQCGGQREDARGLAVAQRVEHGLRRRLLRRAQIAHGGRERAFERSCRPPSSCTAGEHGAEHRVARMRPTSVARFGVPRGRLGVVERSRVRIVFVSEDACAPPSGAARPLNVRRRSSGAARTCSHLRWQVGPCGAPAARRARM